MLVGDTEGHQVGLDVQAGYFRVVMVHGDRSQKLSFRLGVVETLMAARLASIAHQSFLVQVLEEVPERYRLGPHASNRDGHLAGEERGLACLRVQQVDHAGGINAGRGLEVALAEDPAVFDQ